MEILSATQITLQISDIQRWREPFGLPLPRKSGIHLSAVLRVMAVEFNLLKDIDTDDWEEEFPLRMVIGTGVERQIAGFYSDLEWQFGFLEKDLIIGSPDGIIHKRRIWEHKYTHKSCRAFDLNAKKNLLWIWQLMGYAKLSGLSQAELHVIFALGDYTRPYKEQYWRYIVRFAKEELDKFWALVLKFRGKAEVEGHV